MLNEDFNYIYLIGTVVTILVTFPFFCIINIIILGDHIYDEKISKSFKNFQSFFNIIYICLYFVFEVYKTIKNKTKF